MTFHIAINLNSIDVCGGIERELKGGVITSPNYPNTYNTKSQSCIWMIRSSLNRRIKLYFEDLDLPFRRNCSNTDHVTIYENISGSSNSTHFLYSCI